MSNVSRGRLDVAEKAIRLLRGVEASTPTGGQTPLRPTIESDAELPASPEALANSQVLLANELLDRDTSLSVRWSCADLDALTGPMQPGDFVVVGAITGNGKSAFATTQGDHFAASGIPTLYFPLEVDAEVYRLTWAAWRLELAPAAVIRREWNQMPHGAEGAVRNFLEDQKRIGLHFATPKRPSLETVTQWCRWGVQKAGCRVVIIDHIHRLKPDGHADYRVAVTETARGLKDLARELGIVLIATAQLNRNTSEPLDLYIAPQLSRLKESAGIAEESDCTVMLSRGLKRSLPEGFTRDLRLGLLTENDLGDPGIMVATCRKHRLDGDALNKSVRLVVKNSRVVNSARSWESNEAR